MNESNAMLAQKYRQKDEVAFATLVGRHQALVFQVCLRILGHRQDAEDATQETFTRVAKYLHRWDSSRPLEPWLVAIAGNRCRTLLARRRVHQSLSDASEPIGEDAATAHDVDSLQEELVLALQCLPKRQRQAFELFHRRSMSYAEIAEEMGCPVGTVKTWVHRARAGVIEQFHRREVVAGASGEAAPRLNHIASSQECGGDR